MPRQLRIEFEGAIYHVMSRGDRGEPIFEDDKDRETLFKTLSQGCASFPIGVSVSREVDREGRKLPGSIWGVIKSG